MAIAWRQADSLADNRAEIACANLAPIVEAKYAMHDGQPMIHGLRCRFGFLIEWVADVVEQDRLVDFRKRPRRILRQPPAGEV